jgi:predicted transcriptional regulator
MQTPNVKQVAHQLVDRLPDDTTWDEVIYEMIVRRSIEQGIADADAGRVYSHEQVLRKFGIRE